MYTLTDAWINTETCFFGDKEKQQQLNCDTVPFISSNNTNTIIENSIDSFKVAKRKKNLGERRKNKQTKNPQKSFKKTLNV